MSSLILGHSLDMLASASRRSYDVGVAGQSVTGALDQLVTAVSGETFKTAGLSGGAWAAVV